MTSRWGGCLPLERRASRCSTPKRCCSSTTTRPRSWNRTLSSIRAWVPITMPASPVTRSRSAWRRAATPIEPVSSTTFVPCSEPPSMPPSASSPIISVIERWCCWASTSVGASMAACPPASTTPSMARSATMVLPEPTSPWRSRCIGCSVARSSKISRETFCWPSVRVKGSSASKASSSPPGVGLRATAGSWVSAYLRRASATWRTKASSHFSRSRASAMSALVCGRWTFSSASGSGANPRPRAAPHGQRVDGLLRAGQHRVDGLGDPPRVELLAGRVDRQQPPGEGVHRLRGLVGVRGVEQLVRGVGELHLPVEDGDLAREHRPAAGQQLLVRLVHTVAEEDQLEAGRGRR